MTKTISTSYITLLCVAVALAGIATAHASEVTGTLSSDSTNMVSPTGSISGTVTSNSTGGGSSSGGSSRNGSSSSNAPEGSVLGAATSNVLSPSFPNAGVAPEEDSTVQTFWSALLAFFRNMAFF